MADSDPIFLIGMMGSGKSTVGRLLARRLGRPFVDLDEEVVTREGQDIPSLFSTLGEAGFRERERAALLAVLDAESQSGPVVATGGGIVVSDANVETMKNAGLRVYLRVSLPALAERLSGPESAGRPLLARGLDALRVVLDQRRARYEACDIIVDGQPPPDVVAKTTQRAIAERVRFEPDAKS